MKDKNQELKRIKDAVDDPISELQEQNEEAEAQETMQKIRDAEEYFRKAKEKVEQKRIEVRVPVQRIEKQVIPFVVPEIPQQRIIMFPMEDGTIRNFMTMEEALTEVLITIRQLKKAVLG